MTEGGLGFMMSPIDLESVKSLFDWIKAYGPQSEATHAARSEQEEARRLRAELKRVTQEREMLKEAARYFAQEPQ